MDLQLGNVLCLEWVFLRNCGMHATQEREGMKLKNL